MFNEIEDSPFGRRTIVVMCALAAVGAVVLAVIQYFN